MKRIFATYIAIIICSHVKAQGINFETNLTWTQIKEKAVKERKYIFLDCYTTWCKPCKIMDQEIYPLTSAGKALNEKFISVKVQMDKTASDSDEIKKWYEDSAKIRNQYDVNAFPTLLFLTPQGKIATKRVGSIGINGFVSIVKEAQDPKMQFDYLYSLYKSNKLAISEYPALADRAGSQKMYDIALSIRLSYKSKYLDKLPDKRLYDRDVVAFYFWHPELLSYKDRFYILCKDSSEKIDKIRPNMASDVIKAVIINQEILNQLYLNGIPKQRILPDWGSITKEFYKQYPYSDSNIAFYKTKINFYLDLGDWNSLANSVDESIAKCLECTKDGEFCAGLNNWAWFGIFLTSDDKNLQNRALKWCDLAIASEPGSETNIDTKANILYKLGRFDEAIQLEQSIVDAKVKRTGKSESEAGGGFYLTLQKMKRGEPTWIEE